MELTQITLYRFRNHDEFRSPLSRAVAILGKNGSGKTALLEALYFAINAALPPKRAVAELAQDFHDPFFVRFGLLNEAKWPLPYEYLISADPEKKTYSTSIQASSVSRSKYLAAMPFRAVLFSPDDIGIVYGPPSDRRDFLDEILSLGVVEFQSIRKSYQAALKQRNALLKKISRGEAKEWDLEPWDILLASKGASYRAYRETLIQFFSERKSFLESFFQEKYRLSIAYESKTSANSTESEMLEYLRKNRERDSIIGHTYIGPHLDDFFVSVQCGKGNAKSDQFLSRGENKSLFFALKLLGIEFLEQQGGKQALLLLDDIFSELDSEHRDMILAACANRQFFLSSQEMPEIPENFSYIQQIRIGK